MPIKKKQKERVATGIKNFDTLVEGGFERNTTNLLVGGPGSGKSIFALQCLMNNARKGEKCLYVTFEEKKSQIYENMEEFGWDLQELEKKGVLTFLEYTPEKVKVMLEEGGGTIENNIITNKITLLVIDSITSFVLLFRDELAKREATLSLFKMISKWNCTSILTLEEDPKQTEKEEIRALEFESDSITLLYLIRSKKERKRYIEVLKMRGTNHSKNTYEFVIDSEGIDVKTKPSEAS